MIAAEQDLITVTIKRFIEISGLSNTTVYGLMNRGEIETVQIGRRRLIILASCHCYEGCSSGGVRSGCGLRHSQA